MLDHRSMSAYRVDKHGDYDWRIIRVSDEADVTFWAMDDGEQSGPISSRGHALVIADRLDRENAGGVGQNPRSWAVFPDRSSRPYSRKEWLIVLVSPIVVLAGFAFLVVLFF